MPHRRDPRVLSPLWKSSLSILIAIALAPATRAADVGWKAGVAASVITPKGPLWMSGYASRKAPSRGAIHDLKAKALLLADPAGRKALLITLDLCGIDRETSARITKVIMARHAMAREQVALACSHTHCGPVVGSNLIGMYPIDDAERDRIARYTDGLVTAVVNLADQAIASASEAKLGWTIGRAGFAVNRRQNPEAKVPERRRSLTLEGPVDHDVPVLKVARPDGSTLALVFGYACHCTTLGIDQFCGDYAGFTQIELEKRYPGATALFVAGCGADQNPIPRHSIDLAVRYGAELAGAVEHALAGSVEPVKGDLSASYEEIPLAFAAIPGRGQVESDTHSTNVYIASRARGLLKRLDERGSLDSTYPYPVQVWRLGSLEWILLGGEVVVDYSRKIKRSRDPGRVWVSAYCNDVMAYIPSLRVLKEGGYEGGGAMVYYGLPSPWRDDVEQAITAAVVRGLSKLGAD